MNDNKIADAMNDAERYAYWLGYDDCMDQRDATEKQDKNPYNPLNIHWSEYREGWQRAETELINRRKPINKAK